MTGQPTGKNVGWVVSDLHLYARRSDGAEKMHALMPRLASASLLVLNGDIFDFRWSTLPSPEATVQGANHWLRNLLNDLPDTEIHYLIGNHDCLPAHQVMLTTLANDIPRFRWHEHSLQVGNRLFIHGDCTHYPMNMDALRSYRATWSRHGQRGRVAAKAYQVVDRLGFTRFAHRFQFPLEKTLQRLTHHLDDACNGWRERTRQCYFGHTHEPFQDVEHAGLMFHNTGSGIRGMPFNPISFTLGDPAARRAGGGE